MRLFTVGHSTRTSQEFLSILKEYDIQVLVDVRRFPGSKRHPQFSKEELRENLESEGIQYTWLGEELGGYRKEGLGEESPNQAWDSKGFRNYADYTKNEEFKEGIKRLLNTAKNKKVVYMCAEKFYWRCHRRIISDYLKAKGHSVTHIIEKDETREHKLPYFAEVKDGKLSYP
ncbi:MAG: DUF488 family protein [Thermoproteota archaeon]